MKTLTIQLSDEKLTRLVTFARMRGVSVEQSVEEISTQAIADSDAFTRYEDTAARGDAKCGLETLDKLDKCLGGSVLSMTNNISMSSRKHKK